MRLRPALSLALAGALGLAVLGWQPAAQADPLGSGETLLSAGTSPAGVGPTSVARVPGSSRFLVVWEGDRAVGSGSQQGIKREIYGQYVSSTDGSPQGSPVRLVSLGGADDSTLDATDPSVAALANGRIVLAFAGDTVSDTAGAPTPTDTTNLQIFAAVIDPSAPLAAVTPTQVTSVGTGDVRYDQQAPDVADDHGQVRLVWEGDSPVGQDGQSVVWTTLLPSDLSGTAVVTQVSSHPAGAPDDATRPRLAVSPTGSSPDAVVVWEGVDSVASGLPVRRVWAEHLGTSAGVQHLVGSTSTDGSVEETAPDVVADGGGYQVVWSSNSGTGYQIWRRTLASDGTASQAAAALTSGAHDTLPSLVTDPSQPGQVVVAWVRRTVTSGTGHYELSTGRWRTGANWTQLETNQLSSTDADVSANNAESLRPALAYHPGDHTEYAAWGRDRLSGGPGAAGRLIAPRGDVFTTVAPAPANPSPGRVGLNPADPVDVVVGYGNRAASSATLDATLTLALPGFTLDPTTPVTFRNVTGPLPTTTAAPRTLSLAGLAPGQGGEAVFHGTLDAAAEGTVRTATSTITPTGIVFDPALDDTSSADLTVDYPPAVQSITRASATPTNASSVSWTVTFDQAVTGVGTGDFTTTGTGSSSVSSASCSEKTCTVTASVTADGTIGLRVPVSAVIQDTTGKALVTTNLPFDGPSYTVDTVRPTVTVSGDPGDPTNADPITFHLTFSEPVTAPAVGSLSTTDGSLSSVTPATGTATTFDVEVAPTADGVVSLAVPANATTDAAGNGNTAGGPATRTSDRTRPALTLTGPATPRNGPFLVTVTSSEPVTGLALSDIVVTGGSASGLSGAGPWTFTVTPDTEGPVDVKVPAGSVTDAAGNANPNATTSVTYDVTRPDVTVGSAAADPTGSSPVPFTLTFSEPVTGLTAADLVVAGGTAQLSGSGAAYLVKVTPDGDGPVSVGVPAGVASDAAGNTNTAGPSVTRHYDSTRPSALVATGVSSPSQATTIPVTVTWSEVVTGFDASDVAVSGGDVTGFSGSGDSYTLTVQASGDGVVEVSVPAGAAADGAGNQNLAATPLDVTVDTAPPTGAFSTGVGAVTREVDVPVTLTFDEPVTGLSPADLQLTHATADSLTGGGATYHLVVHPTADGDVSVALPAGAVTDLAGNAGAAVAPLTFTYDSLATADLTYAGPALVNAPVQMSLHLSDPAALDPTDFVTTNASVSLTGSGDTWTVTVIPSGDGDVSVRLAAGAFTDAAGNLSTASATRTFRYDVTAPTVAPVAPSLARAPYPVDVTFSEPVTALDLGQVSVSNGVASGVSGSGDHWSFTVTPAHDGDVAVSLDTGAAYDAAGNASAPSGPVTTSYDTTAPTVQLTSPTSDVVTTSPIPVAVTLSEPVLDALATPSGSGPLSLADFHVTHGTVTNLQGGGTSYTISLVPDGEGTTTVTVPAGALVDAAGNPSTAGNVLSRELDSTRPTVAMTTTAADPTNLSQIPVTVRFSKAVLGFDVSDLQVDGAGVGAFAALDDRTWTFDLDPTRDGTVSVTIPENAAASVGGNLAFGTSLSLTVDRVAPRPVITGPAGTTYDGPVSFAIVSPEPLVGLTAGDLLVGGTAHPTTLSLTQADGRHWTAVLSGMARPGSVSLRLPAGAAADLAGNPSLVAGGSAAWSRHVTFALVQAPGSRSGNLVTVPLEVAGSGGWSWRGTSSNARLLPASRISISPVSGTHAVLTLDGKPHVTGRSRVVLRAVIGGVHRTIALEYIVGGPDDNRLVGTRGADVILGRPGADHLYGRGGSDYVYAGYGDDVVRAGSGADLIVGSKGHDVLYGGPGRDGFVVMADDSRPDFDPAQDFLIHLSRSTRARLAE